MLSVQEMTCSECGSTNTCLEMKRAKDGRVYFNVICDDHGGFSHRLLRSEINQAVEDWLKAHSEALTNAVRKG